ncbi:hypothetical protein A0M39_09535 [Campylobacter jejuni]|uniref:hypothetical protein n=1 Tax=Campylobacter TaxID=194 RepID=UPI0009427886|nr:MULTISPECIES: hypothetical protein [Campylobacter]EFP2893699.1 hypothetical protein [Campylobacter jejuni]EHD2445689.1 hypothetical protein [Campylobacter jejuni]OKY02053.1 hypothetical protein A0M39_09535 [Campylobacter jejuni]PCH28337.1 hypothetical protein BGS46_09860 [Campylobacter sp. 113]HDZ4292077.1 hypothetical protein [Campylobacter jejuni]
MAKNVKIGVSVDTNSGVASIGGLNKSFNQLGNVTQATNKYIKDIEKSFLGLSKSVIDMNAHLTQAYQGYKTLALDIKNFGSSFIEASKSFETAKTQLAFITATTHSNIDATGKAISQLEKWKAATKSSEKTFKDFNDLHTKTGYSLQDLASMFRSFSSTALNNMSFDEAKKAFESIMIATSNTSMTTEQLSMTMDSLGAGVFSASGDLRRFAESLGITNDAMSEAKKNGKLFDLFIEKTKELTKYTDYTTQTYEKQMQKFEANMQMLKAEISKPIFDALKNSLIDINTYIKDNEKEIKADIKAITEFATSFKDLAIGAGLAYVAFKSFNSFKNSSFFTSLSNGIKNVKKDYDDLIIKQKEMKELVINQRNLKFQAQSFKDAIKDLERLQSLMPQKAKEVSNLAPFYSTSQKTMISAEKMLLQQEALKNIRNLEEEIKKNETLINESILKRNPLLSTIKGTMSNLANSALNFTKALAPTAGLIALMTFIEKLYTNWDNFDKALEKTSKRKLENKSSKELDEYVKNLKSQMDALEANGSVLGAQITSKLDFWYIKEGVESVLKGTDYMFESVTGKQLKMNKEARKAYEQIQANLKLAEEAAKKAKEQEFKLEAIDNLPASVSKAMESLKALRIPQSTEEQAENLRKQYELISETIQQITNNANWNKDLAKLEQYNALVAQRTHYEEYINKQEEQRLKKEKEIANQKLAERIKEQNEALKEISQIGMSEYDKKLSQINEKLKAWKKLGIDKNKLKQAEESLKINLDLESANKDFEDTKNLMIEFYESIENKQEAWALKEIELRDKYSKLLSENLIKEEDFKKMIKANKDAYFQMGKDSKKAMSEVEKNYNQMIANMQKTIESSFFDVINGKIKTLKDLFKDLGKTILQDFLSPYISSLSGFLSKAGAGVLSGLMPNFAFGNVNSHSQTNAFSSVVEFAKNQGLNLNSDGKYQGVVNGVEVVMDKTGTIEKGNNAFNNVSNIIEGASKLDGIMSGEWIDKAGATYDKVMNWFGSSQNAGSEISFSDALNADGFSDFLSSSSDISTTIENSSTNIIDSIGNGFNSLFDNLQGYINSIGTFGSNLLANGSAYLANFLGLGASFTNGASLAGMGLSGASNALSLGFGGGLGYIGGTLANAAMGGLLGYGIGSLGDWLFKADTHAGTGGAIGGALGSIIMPGIGTIVGGLLGSVIGGIFGKTKVTGSGLQLWENINFSDFFTNSNLQGYVDYQKKGWFSKKSWTEYNNLSDKKIKEINRVLENQYATLVKLNANLDKFELVAGKYANNSLFDTALPTALLKSFLNIDDKSEIDAQIVAIQEKAKANNISYAQQLSNQFGTFMQMQTSILNQIYKNDPTKQAKLAYDDTMYALKTAMRNATGGFSLFGLSEESFKDLGQLSAEALNKAFNESLRQDFSPENLEIWQQLTQAYTQAQEQVKNLLNSIIQKTQELMQINQSFLSANGISSSIFEVNHLMNSYATLMSGLKDDLNDSEKEMLKDIFSANDKLLSLGYEGLNEFLSTGNTELRKQLVDIITQFKQISDKQGGLIFSSEHLNKLAEVEKLINAYENKDESKEADQVRLNENNKLLSKLNSELGILSSLGSFSTNLINQSIATSESVALNYDKILKQAKNDFKNGNLTSSSFSALQNAATQKANEIKNQASSFAEYQLQMLKMANEMKDLGGEADLNSIQDKIEAITEENKKLQEKLDQTLKDTSNMTLEELKEYKKTLIAQSEAEIAKMIEYLGEESPMAKYLQETIKSIKDGASLTETTLKNLEYALLQYQNNQANIDKDLNNEIKNPYKKMKAFADGGIVTRPTNALIGENGYPEAVIPLKNGKGLKIDASGVFEKIGIAFEKAINKGFNSFEEKLDLIASKIDNVDKSVKRANMDLSILTKQTREIAENI